MNDPFVSGSYDFDGQIRVDALGEESHGLPAWVTYIHETAHMEIACFSAVGLFQRLLALLEESTELVAEESTAARGLQERLARGTFRTQEGVAAYCVSVHILQREPSLLPRYISTLDQDYRMAFRSVAPLLPKPPVSLSHQEMYRHHVLAILLGMYCCSAPLIELFASRERLLEWQTIDLELPDERLRNTARHASELREIADKMASVIDADMASIEDGNPTQLEFHDRVQEAWIEWTARYEQSIVGRGLPHHPMSLEILQTQREALISKWRLSNRFQILPRSRSTEMRSFLQTEAILPHDRAGFQIDADLQSPEEVQALLANCADGRTTLLIARDLTDSFSANVELRPHDDGRLAVRYKDPGEFDILVVHDATRFTPIPRTPIPVARFKGSATDVRAILPATARERFFWVVDGPTYIRRQVLIDAMQVVPPFAYPRALMRFKSLAALLDSMQTLQPPYIHSVYAGLIGGEPALGFLGVGSDFMFALLADENQWPLFHDLARRMGAHDWAFTEPAMHEMLRLLARMAFLGTSLLNALETGHGS
jgi:hypothetical protein